MNPITEIPSKPDEPRHFNHKWKLPIFWVSAPISAYSGYTPLSVWALGSPYWRIDVSSGIHFSSHFIYPTISVRRWTIISKKIEAAECKLICIYIFARQHK